MITIQSHRFTHNLNDWTGFLNRRNTAAHAVKPSKWISDTKLVVHLTQKIQKQKAQNAAALQASISSMLLS
jgi:hypothetical protein